MKELYSIEHMLKTPHLSPDILFQAFKIYNHRGHDHADYKVFIRTNS